MSTEKKVKISTEDEKIYEVEKSLIDYLITVKNMFTSFMECQDLK